MAHQHGQAVATTRRHRFALAAFASILGCGAPAAADPQWHLAAASGACWRQASARTTHWCNGLRGHLLFGRERDRDLGLGPYARLTNLWGGGNALGTGASALLPLSATYPFVLSLGAVVESHREARNAGFEAWLFWGPSSYNFHSSYSMASGLLAGLWRTWGERNATTLALAAQLDLVWLSIPFIALFEVTSGSSND